VPSTACVFLPSGPLQAYSALRAGLTVGQAATASGRPAGQAAWLDPLGLSPVVLPVLEVLDAMYAGRQVRRKAWEGG
jgi:hypothetical protein